MDRQFWISGIAIAVLAFALGFVVHGVLLAGDYAPLAGTLYRTPEEATRFLPYLLIAHLSFGFAITWIYRQGKTPGEPWLGQGLRFGLAIVALMTIPMYLIYYAVQPTPGMLAAKQILFDGASTVIIGAALAWLNRAPGEG